MKSVFMGTLINYLLVNLEMFKKSNETFNKINLARTFMKIRMKLSPAYYHWLQEDV